MNIGAVHPESGDLYVRSAFDSIGNKGEFNEVVVWERIDLAHSSEFALPEDDQQLLQSCKQSDWVKQLGSEQHTLAEGQRYLYTI